MGLDCFDHPNLANFQTYQAGSTLIPASKSESFASRLDCSRSWSCETLGFRLRGHSHSALVLLFWPLAAGWHLVFTWRTPELILRPSKLMWQGLEGHGLPSWKNGCGSQLGPSTAGATRLHPGQDRMRPDDRSCFFGTWCSFLNCN